MTNRQKIVFLKGVFHPVQNGVPMWSLRRWLLEVVSEGGVPPPEGSKSAIFGFSQLFDFSHSTSLRKDFENFEFLLTRPILVPFLGVGQNHEKG